MASVVNNNKRDKVNDLGEVKSAPLPFIDFLLCSYVYIGNSSSDTNNKGIRKTNNDSKRGRR